MHRTRRCDPAAHHRDRRYRRGRTNLRAGRYGELAETALTLPQTLDPLQRKVLLAQLVVKWASSRDLHGAAGTPLVANTPSAALLLADDLARLIDDMTARGVGWDKL